MIKAGIQTAGCARGRFFTVDRRIWTKVCDLGMNPAAAYLVLACGTGPDNSTTAWSTTSVSKYAGIGVVRSKTAVEDLIEQGFVRRAEGSTREHPRYELISASPNDVEDESDRIWLPNTIVTGTPNGEIPPVQRLHRAGDPWALRLFVDLYHVHNLRDDGGISPKLLHGEYMRQRVGENGVYVIWGFKCLTASWLWLGPLAPHEKRTENTGDPDQHPVWESIQLLRDTGLISFVPHLYDSDASDAELLHPYGIGGSDEDPVESQLGEAAGAAARAMSCWNVERAESEGFEHFCPVLQTIPNVQMVGVPRLRYRPHTRRTSAWYASLQNQGRAFLQQYQELASEAELRLPEDFRNFA